MLFYWRLQQFYLYLDQRSAPINSMNQNWTKARPRKDWEPVWVNQEMNKISFNDFFATFGWPQIQFKIRTTKFPMTTVARKNGIHDTSPTSMQSHMDSIHSPHSTRNTIMNECMKSVKFQRGISPSGKRNTRSEWKNVLGINKIDFVYKLTENNRIENGKKCAKLNSWRHIKWCRGDE